ncbi:hypothetical protein [Helicovermis profundi]|uniref:Uncharacterized protein n=1 Tax=Helicovermis profundi TaxID=3065157 RepID=A0AAU9E854_9FIRM|nr:hypothetical protein HLPR_19540 [Clostridia bacterium S502]
MFKKVNRAEKKKRENNSWLKKWEETRKMGIIKYTILYGVLMWGALTSLFFQIINRLSKNFTLISFKSQVLMPTLTFMIGGIFVGIALWYLSESKYKKHMKKIILEKKIKRENRKNKKMKTQK